MRLQSRSPLATVMLLGLLVRLPVVATDFHTSTDLDVFRRWARLIRERGLTAAYATPDVNYPPLVVYAFGASAALEGALPDAWRANDRAMTALIKSWPLLADTAIAVLIAGLLIDAAPAVRAAAVAGYLLHPAVWYTSAHWGQLESVYTLFLLASVVALSRWHLLVSWVCFSLAAMTKQHALALLPLMIAASLRRGGWKALATGIVAAAGTGAVVAAPWLLAGKAGDLLRDWTFAPGPPRVDVSAYNLWYVIFLGRVHAVSSALGSPFSYRTIGAALFAALAMLVAGLLWRRRERTLPLAAAILGLGFFLLPTEVHERFMFPALPFLLLATVDPLDRSTTRDRKALAGAWVLLSITFSFNLMTIASPLPRLWTNLVAASDATPLTAVLKALALAAAAINLIVFVRLLGLLARR